MLVCVNLEAVGSCLDITIDLVLVLVQNGDLYSKINQETGTVTYEGEEEREGSAYEGEEEREGSAYEGGEEREESAQYNEGIVVK